MQLDDIWHMDRFKGLTCTKTCIMHFGFGCFTVIKSQEKSILYKVSFRHHSSLSCFKFIFLYFTEIETQVVAKISLVSTGHTVSVILLRGRNWNSWRKLKFVMLLLLLKFLLLILMMLFRLMLLLLLMIITLMVLLCCF